MKSSRAFLVFISLAVVLLSGATKNFAKEAIRWQPVNPPMLTRWAKDIDPQLPLPEYPRPQMTRQTWQNLNGLWDYSVAAQGSAEPASWDGKILVPYPIESALSGVKRALKPDEVLYYHRDFDVPNTWQGQRVLLHFGAVDYRTKVFVNGKLAGEHEGGYDPFSFDITELLNDQGEQKLVVAVSDPTWTAGQPRGKQTLSPAGIMYTPTSGIWQTVWLEPVAKGGIEDLHIVPDVKGSAVTVSVDLQSDAQGEVTISVEDGQSATGKAGDKIRVPVPNPTLWTPDDPHLYRMSVSLTRDGKVVDEVDSYFGMRSIEMARVDGKQQLLLNGKPIFMYGPLDQGFWPDGCYTAPTDNALKSDLEVTKELGFNTVRKHIKVEPARWYYHADRLGLLVWQDMPSANSYDEPPGGRPEIDRQAYETQLKAMIDKLENHPAIVMWIVFNESQGKHDTQKLVQLVRRLDPSRLVNEDSGFQGHGGPYQGFGDLFDCHPYPAPQAFKGPDSKAFVLGEYGGIGLKVGKNPWQAKGWGYTTTQTAEELENLYANYADLLRQFKERNGLNAAIYTQLTDVEIEINGLLTYDRQLKVDPKWIAKANHFEWAGPTYESLVPTSETTSQEYQYTLTEPGADWMKIDADTSNWENGQGGFGTRETPGIGKIGTEWGTRDIWLRRTFDLPALSEAQLKRLVLRLFHDEDVEVYINGELALKKEGFVSSYTQLPLSAESKKALKLGARNLIALHCRQTRGGQFIDVGLGVVNDERD
jgi:hypothetical protein